MQRGKKGAIELSMTTVVIVVLSMTMLILGLVLIKTILEGAKGSVTIIDQKVKAEINKLFVDEQQAIAVNLPELQASMTKKRVFGVAVAIRTSGLGGTGYTYNVKVEKPDSRCGVITETLANSFIVSGKTGTFNLDTNTPFYALIRFQPTLATPTGCILRYDIDVPKLQASAFFDVEVT